LLRFFFGEIFFERTYRNNKYEIELLNVIIEVQEVELNGQA